MKLSTARGALQHSARHLLETASLLQLTTPSAVARAAAPNTLAALLGVGAAYLLVRADASEAVLVLVFVGLACLTVPHMVLIEFAKKSGRA